MPFQKIESGFVNIENANIYYECAGTGTPLVMIHAGVADNRQWNNEFLYFSKNYRVLRYDMRGYGRSEPVQGEFSHLDDLVSILDYLDFNDPLLLMGCSMGGGLAMDFTLKYPSRAKALIMVGSGPGGLELDIEEPAKFSEGWNAYNDGDLDLVAEIETQIWFDGEGRSPDQVDGDMRKLLYEMNRTAIGHEVKELGKLLPNLEKPAYNRLDELDIPVLIILGTHDVQYMIAAADFMERNIKSVQKIIIEDAAHLPNMDHPHIFQDVVEKYLGNV